METRTKKVEKKIYVEKCPYCKTEIVGTSETHARWNMQIHKKSKHKEEEND